MIDTPTIDNELHRFLKVDSMIINVFLARIHLAMLLRRYLMLNGSLSIASYVALLYAHSYRALLSLFDGIIF